MSRGYDVWWDRTDLPAAPGDVLLQIQGAIEACDFMLLVLDAAGLASEFVAAEWQHALAVRCSILPIAFGLSESSLDGRLLRSAPSLLSAQVSHRTVLSTVLRRLRGMHTPASEAQHVLSKTARAAEPRAVFPRVARDLGPQCSRLLGRALAEPGLALRFGA
jgi:hypothetical protein